MVKFFIILYVVALSITCGYEYMWLKKASVKFNQSAITNSPRLRALRIAELDAKLTLQSLRLEEMKVLGLKIVPFTPWTNEMRSNAVPIDRLDEQGMAELAPLSDTFEVIEGENTSVSPARDEPCPDGSSKENCRWRPLN